MLLVAEQDPPKSGQPGDETWKTYSPPVSQPYPETPSTPPPEQLPPTHVPYGAKQDYSGTYPPAPGSPGVTLPSNLLSTKTRGCGWIAFVVTAVVFLGIVFGVIAIVRAVSDGFDGLDDGLGGVFDAGEKPDLHSAAGFEDMLDALSNETGSTTVMEVVLYPEYAVLTIPADGNSKRYYSYYYDGDLQRTSQGTTESKRFDLSTIDPAVMVKLIDKAKTATVEDPTTVYAIIEAPAEYMNGAWFSVYASNAFAESGYFTADKNGKIIQEYAPPPQ